MAALFIIDLSLLFLAVRTPVQQMSTPVIKLDLFVVSEFKYINQSNGPPLTVSAHDPLIVHLQSIHFS